MDIIFFTHPSFTYSQSMPRYTYWLMEGMRERGHGVRLLKPTPYFFKLPLPSVLKKWMGYIDQFIIFPLQVRRIIAKAHSETLYVVTDHALGPWVPLVKDRFHVVHCHDFLAQRSALGEIPGVTTGRTGRFYQTYIRRGYSKAKNYISVSKQTEKELLELIDNKPEISEVVYNGLTQTFSPVSDLGSLRRELQSETGISLEDGFLLHVGGNQWYKNREGVIEIYNSWRNTPANKLPLLMIGEKPGPELKQLQLSSIHRDNIHFLIGKSDQFVKRAYAAATLFIFPSHAEGFGWPIVEAMASGCPVLTTGEAPMTEVGGDAAIYIPKKPSDKDQVDQWAFNASEKINMFIDNEPENRQRLQTLGFNNARRFDPALALDKIESIYLQIVSQKSNK